MAQSEISEYVDLIALAGCAVEVAFGFDQPPLEGERFAAVESGEFEGFIGIDHEFGDGFGDDQVEGNRLLNAQEIAQLLGAGLHVEVGLRQGVLGVAYAQFNLQQFGFGNAPHRKASLTDGVQRIGVDAVAARGFQVQLRDEQVEKQPSGVDGYVFHALGVGAGGFLVADGFGLTVPFQLVKTENGLVEPDADRHAKIRRGSIVDVGLKNIEPLQTGVQKERSAGSGDVLYQAHADAVSHDGAAGEQARSVGLNDLTDAPVEIGQGGRQVDLGFVVTQKALVKPVTVAQAGFGNEYVGSIALRQFDGLRQGQRNGCVVLGVRKLNEEAAEQDGYSGHA